jgi:hypothetical protein
MVFWHRKYQLSLYGFDNFRDSRLSVKTEIFFGLILLIVFSSENLLAASPRINYLLYCSGCHTPNGQGSAPNVPTLRRELGEMMAAQEMRGYLARVPGSAQAPIDDAELTGVINWILHEFNSETLPQNFVDLTVEEIAKARIVILADPNKYRETYWRGY